MLSSLRAGLRSTLAQPWLAALLWAWSAALSIVAAAPAAVWLSRGLSLRPRGDVLLDGFSFEVLKELVHYDASPVTAVLWWAAVGPLALAAVGSALVNGGVLEVLWARESTPDPRPRLHRFFRGAGRYVLVHLRVLLLSSMVAAVVLVAALAVLSPLSTLLEDTQRELLAWVDLLLPLLVVVTVVVLWGTVLDFARLRVVATDDRRALPALAWALRHVVRHPIGTVGIWKSLAFATLLVAAAAALLVPFVPVRGWVGVLGLVVAQQALVFVRALLRVATVAAEAHHGGARGVAAEGPARREIAAPPAVAPEAAAPYIGEGL